jgi:hypothetical protein
LPAEEAVPAPPALHAQDQAQSPVLVRADIELPDGRYLLAYSHADA